MGNVLYFVSKYDETSSPQLRKSGQLEINVAKPPTESVQPTVNVASNLKTNRPKDTPNLVHNQQQQVGHLEEVVKVVVSDDEDEYVRKLPKLNETIFNCFPQSSTILNYVSQPPVRGQGDYQFVSHTYKNIGLKAPFKHQMVSILIQRL
ncbi:hypothetical protein M3Y98_01228400 [Aphelenchoides besseyi]|nr:hypothetical protein M3Y98_01228400 [Aphelenchoides besseyi]